MDTIKGWASMLWTYVQFWLGILVGWLTHPAVWWISFTPFRVLHFLSARAAQESGGSASALNPDDNGYSSGGLLQFWEPTWTALSGRPLEDRFSPFLSGYYGVAMLQDALLRSWKWWIVLRVPVLGYSSLCYLWTHGTSGDNAWTSVGGGLTQLKSESRAVWGYLFWGAIFGVMGVLAVASFVRAWTRRKDATKEDRKTWVYRTLGRDWKVKR